MISEKQKIKILIEILADQIHEAQEALGDMKVGAHQMQDMAQILDTLDEAQTTVKEIIEKEYWR